MTIDGGFSCRNSNSRRFRAFTLGLALLAAIGGTSSKAAIQPTSPASSPTPQFQIHDFMPDFWHFWDAAEGQPTESQARLWRDLYVQPHQAVFDDLETACQPEFDPAWADAHYFPNLPKIVPEMRVAATGLPQMLAAAHVLFIRKFPDMHWTGDVYVMAAGYCFNGRAQTIQGRDAILLGVDTRIALGQKDAVPEITHELFHRYHRQFFDFKPSSGDTMWATLWAEGMALSVEERLNPKASDADLSLVPIGMAQRVDLRRRELAGRFLEVFDATDDENAKRWFNDTNSVDPVVPARAGYELGALVVRELAKQASLRTMAHWSRSDAEPRIRAALKSIAGP